VTKSRLESEVQSAYYLVTVTSSFYTGTICIDYIEGFAITCAKGTNMMAVDVTNTDVEFIFKDSLGNEQTITKPMDDTMLVYSYNNYDDGFFCDINSTSQVTQTTSIVGSLDSDLIAVMSDPCEVWTLDRIRVLDMDFIWEVTDGKDISDTELIDTDVNISFYYEFCDC
jgi:hypothetical protein